MHKALAPWLLVFVASFAAAQSEVPEPGKEARIVFDIADSNPRALLGKLTAIEETRQSLIKMGVTPRIVLSFRTGAGRFTQTDPERLAPEEREMGTMIAAKIRAMNRAPGVQALQQCGLSNRMMSIPADKVMPEVKVVENSWIALVAYQQQGYTYIAP